MKKTFFILFSIILLACVKLEAQVYKTSEGLSSQIKNNKTPGALYAPATQKNQTAGKGYEGSSLGKALREGKLDGLQFNHSATSPPKPVINTPTAKPGSLASDISAGEAKANHEKVVKETQVKTLPPPLTQEEKKE